MQLVITIDCDNDAFRDGNLADECARVLWELSEKIRRSPETATVGCDRITLRDLNGNTVGTAEFVEYGYLVTTTPRRQPQRIHHSTERTNDNADNLEIL